MQEKSYDEDSFDSIREILSGYGDDFGYGCGCGYDNLQGINTISGPINPDLSAYLEPKPPITFEELGRGGYNYMNGTYRNKTSCKMDGTGITVLNCSEKDLKTIEDEVEQFIIRAIKGKTSLKIARKPRYLYLS